MRLVLATAVVLVAVVVSACDGDADQATPTGRVDGTFRVVGGPAPGIDRPLAGSVTFDGPVRRTVDAGADGRFSLDLPPGTYVVTGRDNKGYAPDACAPSTGTVASGETIAVAVRCVVE